MTRIFSVGTWQSVINGAIPSSFILYSKRVKLIFPPN